MLGLRSNTNPLWLLPRRVRRRRAHVELSWCARRKLQSITQYGACESIVTTSSFWKGRKEVNIWGGGAMGIKLIVARNRYICPGLYLVLLRPMVARKKGVSFFFLLLPPCSSRGWIVGFFRSIVSDIISSCLAGICSVVKFVATYWKCMNFC